MYSIHVHDEKLENITWKSGKKKILKKIIFTARYYIYLRGI